MAQGRRPPRRRCQRRARGGCGASGAPGVPHRESGAAGCKHARSRARSHRVVPSRCRRGRRRRRAGTIRAAADVSRRHYRPGARRGVHQLHQPDVRARGSAAPRVPHPPGARRRPVAPDPAVRGRMPGACRDCRRAGAAVRRLGDVDGDEPRLGARSRSTSRSS